MAALHTDTDVAVIGYGPTGAVLTNLLGARGWRVTAFDRLPDVVHTPRAVHFDAEVMRVFQQIGIAETIAPAIAPVRGMDMLNADGELLARFTASPEPGPLGWHDGYMFFQPDVERALRRRASTYGSVTTRLGEEVTSIQPQDDGSVRVVSRPAEGVGAERSLGARFVVGCCGARSIARAAIDAPLDDYGLDQPWLVLDLLLHDGVTMPSITIQYCDPRRPSTYVMMPGRRCRFEIMLMPGDTPEAMLDPAAIAERLSRWLAPSQYGVERAAVYAFHGLVARQWGAGATFIAGDAAHQMPPFLGQGLCAGVRDAANLAWKLDLVLRGDARASLLDTYQQEREPHVRAVIETDIYLGNLIQTTDADVARQRDAAARSGGPVTLVPPIPTIGAGLDADGDACGRPSPQPLFEDGRRGDALLGDGFGLVGDVTPGEQARAILDRLGARVLPMPVPMVRAWLADAGARAAIIRPDRIVLALVDTPDDLDRALAPIAAHLTRERNTA
jgi:3-(3-hydroxy-phenyl)propionate hydroxylase